MKYNKPVQAKVRYMVWGECKELEYIVKPEVIGSPEEDNQKLCETLGKWLIQHASHGVDVLKIDMLTADGDSIV